MSSFTPRLLLKRNDGPDPFKRQDFSDNFDKIDAAPGRHICTSTTRPGGWGSAQAGRQIVETDTLRALEWSGSAWVEPRNTVMQWGFAVSPGIWLNSGTSGTYTLGTVTASRPMHYTIIAAFRLAARPYLYTQALSKVLVDDVDKTFGGTGDTSWADQQSSASQPDERTQTTFGTGVMTPGNHVLKGRVTVQTTSSNTVWAGRITFIVLATAPSFGATTYL